MDTPRTSHSGQARPCVRSLERGTQPLRTAWTGLVPPARPGCLWSMRMDPPCRTRWRMTSLTPRPRPQRGPNGFGWEEAPPETHPGLASSRFPAEPPRSAPRTCTGTNRRPASRPSPIAEGKAGAASECRLYGAVPQSPPAAGRRQPSCSPVAIYWTFQKDLANRLYFYLHLLSRRE